MLNYPRKQCTKKAWLKIVIRLMPVLFHINSNRTSKSSRNRYADIGWPWSTPFSKLKYGVVNPPFITHDGWSFNIFMQYLKYSPKPNLRENQDLKNQTLFLYPL